MHNNTYTIIICLLFYILYSYITIGDEQPEVQVKVNNVLAACLKFDCKYEVKQDITPVISKLETTSLGLSMEFAKGSAEPADKTYSKNDITQIIIGGAICTDIVVDKSGDLYVVTCTLPKN